MLISNQLSIEVVEMDRVITDGALEKHCRRLSYGGDSGMNSALNHYKRERKTLGRSIDAKAIFAIYGQTVGGNYERNPIGWALWAREADGYYFQLVSGQIAFQICVDSQFRRKGVGTRLMQTACSLTRPGEQIQVYYYSNPHFFGPFKDKGLCGEVR